MEGGRGMGKRSSKRKINLIPFPTFFLSSKMSYRVYHVENGLDT